MERTKVYELVDGERNYQDKQWGGRPHDDMTSVGDFLVFMEQYLHRAKEKLTTETGIEPAMDMIRKVTALGVAAMETHGAPERKI